MSRRTDLMLKMTLEKVKMGFLTFDDTIRDLKNSALPLYRIVEYAVDEAASAAKISKPKMYILLDGERGAKARAEEIIMEQE